MKYDISTSSRESTLLSNSESSTPLFQGLSNNIQGIHAILISLRLFTLSSINISIQRSLQSFDFETSFFLNWFIKRKPENIHGKWVFTRSIVLSLNCSALAVTT